MEQPICLPHPQPYFPSCCPHTRTADLSALPSPFKKEQKFLSLTISKTQSSRTSTPQTPPRRPEPVEDQMEEDKLVFL